MKKYISIIILAIITSSMLSAQDILSKYLETAATNNPGLKAKFSEYMSALETIPQVGALPDPQFAFGYFIKPIETRNGPQRVALSLSQMFPWFGTTGAKKEVATSQAKAKYESFEAYKSKLFFDVQATYYDLYFIGKGIDISYENIRILESFRNLALIKIEAGKASGLDEIRIEMELAELENKLAFLKDRWSFHSVKFNKLLNVDNNSPINIPDSLWNLDLLFSRQAVMDSLKLRNPEVRKLDFMIEAYMDKELVARRSGAPSFSLGIDYFVIGKTENAMADINNGSDALLFPKIGITIPLYRKKYNAMVNEAVFMQEAMAGAKEEKVNALEVLFEQSYNDYQDAIRRIELYHSQRILAEKGIQILEAEYSTNGKDFEEILRMERRLLSYALELQKAYADKQVSVAFINYLMGI